MYRSLILLHSAGLCCALGSLTSQADVVISSDPSQNMMCSTGICTPTAPDAVLNINDLTNLLATGDVAVVTSIDKKQDAHNIDLLVPLSWSNSTRLTLTASNRLTIGAPVVVLGSGGLAITNPCWPCLALTNGSNITFQNTNSSLIIGGVSYTLVADLPILINDIAAQKDGYYALANDYDARDDHFSGAPIPRFDGSFTALGHSIANFTISHGSKKCVGLIGLNSRLIRDIHLTAVSVSVRQGSVGGLVGCNQSHGDLLNVSVDGMVFGSGNVGGIVGSNSGTIDTSRAAVTVAGNQAGGIAGTSDGIISQSFSIGSVAGDSNAGGLVGSSSGPVKNSYALGSVSADGGAAGGLAGFNDGSIQHTYSIGSATGLADFTGGFVGYDPNEGISASYWNLETSGLSNGAGFPQGDPGMTGLTTAQFQAHIPRGFSRAVWTQRPDINGGYPYLIANPPP